MNPHRSIVGRDLRLTRVLGNRRAFEFDAPERAGIFGLEGVDEVGETAADLGMKLFVEGSGVALGLDRRFARETFERATFAGLLAGMIDQRITQ